jgi:hypothetical protein
MVMLELSALPQVLGDGIGNLLVGRILGSGGHYSAGLDLEPTRFFRRQGMGQPQPQDAGHKITASEFHDSLLVQGLRLKTQTTN